MKKELLSKTEMKRLIYVHMQKGETYEQAKKHVAEVLRQLRATEMTKKKKNIFEDKEESFMSQFRKLKERTR